jgi:hypothetical protein
MASIKLFKVFESELNLRVKKLGLDSTYNHFSRPRLTVILFDDITPELSERERS